MYINRNIEKSIENELINYEKPICILGSRQVGKTTTIKHCLNNTDYIYVNMFDTQGINDIFNENLDISVDRIIFNLSIMFSREITLNTVIVLDEIQANPAAMASLKSFNENKKYKVIALGSNLGSFILQKSKFSFPVGQIKILNMYSISFSEFIKAKGERFLFDKLISGIKEKNIDRLIHLKMLELFDEFMIVGGMPEVVSKYIKSSDISKIEEIKDNLIVGYLNDFGKYELNNTSSKRLNVIYSSIGQFLNKDNQKFIFSEVKYEFKQLEKALIWMQSNNYLIITPIISSLNLPLSQHEKISSFKLFSSETSLLLRQSDYNPYEIIKQKDKIYYGFMMENYIATVLNKYNKVYNYRKNKLEIDFICAFNNKTYAFEVKSGNNTKSQSLKSLKNTTPDISAIKLSRNELSFGNIMNIPLYVIDILFEEKLQEILKQ